MTESFPKGVTAENRRLIGVTALPPLEEMGEQILTVLKGSDMPLHFIAVDPNYCFPTSKRRDNYSGYEPEGILKCNWFEKHVFQLPSVLLAVLPFEPSLSDNEWKKREGSLQKDVQKVYEQIQGNKIKLVVILLQERDYSQSQESKERLQLAKERILSLRRQVDLDSKSVHLLYTSDLNLKSDSVKKILSSANSMSIDCIKADGKQGKHMRTSVSIGGMPKKSQIVLKIRQSVKLGQFYDMRHEETKAKKEYLRAYDDLVAISAAPLPFPITMNEVKAVAQILFFKLCRLHFSLSHPNDATRCFRDHLRTFRDLPLSRTRSMSMATDEDQITAMEIDNTLTEIKKMSWAGRQCIIFADLLRESRGVSVDQRRSFQVFQESYYVFQAVTFERRRRILAQELPATKEVVTNNSIVQSKYVGGNFEVPSDSNTSETESQRVLRSFLVARELGARHSNRVIALIDRFTQARAREFYPEFDRLVVTTRLMMMEEYVLLKQYTRALSSCETCVNKFKSEGWNSFLTRSLRVGVKCALECGDRQRFAEYSIFLMSPASKALPEEKAQVQDSLLKCLGNPKALGTQLLAAAENNNECPDVIELPIAGNGAETPKGSQLLESKVVFAKNMELMGNSYKCTVRLQSNFPGRIHFKRVEIVLQRIFGGKTETFDCTARDNTSVQERLVNNSIIEQGSHTDTTPSPEREGVGAGLFSNLCFEPNEAKTFEFEFSETDSDQRDLVVCAERIKVYLDCQEATENGVAELTKSVMFVMEAPNSFGEKLERIPDRLTYPFLLAQRTNFMQTGVYGLLGRNGAVEKKRVESVVEDIEVESCRMIRPEFLLAPKLHADGPALAGEWHKAKIVFEICGSVAANDMPKDVQVNVALRCVGVKASLAYRATPGAESLTYCPVDGGDKNSFEIGISSEGEISVCCFLHVKANSGAWEEPSCSLMGTVSYSSDRCARMSNDFKFAITIKQPFDVAWNIVSRRPELLVQSSNGTVNSVPDTGGKINLTMNYGATAFYKLACDSSHDLRIENVEFVPVEGVSTPCEPLVMANADGLGQILKVGDLHSNYFGLSPISFGSHDTVGKLKITWSRASAERGENKPVETLIPMPPVYVHPLNGLTVEVKSPPSAVLGETFDVRVYVVNSTVACEEIEISLLPNDNFLCAGRTNTKLVVLPMSTVATSFCFIGIKIGHSLQPGFKVHRASDGTDLIDSMQERVVFVKPLSGETKQS